MKPILMRHVEVVEQSFKAWKNGEPYTRIPWHYHPECELTYIKKGKGTLFIGDNVMEYGNGEVVLIGSDLPHEWRSEVKEPDFYSETYSVHFRHNFLGETFLELPETAFINTLLEKSGRGIRLENDVCKDSVKSLVIELVNSTGVHRINLLLKILNALYESRDITYLSSNSFIKSIDFDQNQRMIEVYEFVMKNFRRSIKISEVATLVNMTSTSFCRFFKKRANKSFISYLNEIRIGYACKLLLEGELTVSQIAYESGFGNISNFNKQFKNIKKITPTEYMDEFFERNSD